VSNLPLTSNSDVQQMPSVAVDPNDPNHVVVAYMDYSLLHAPGDYNGDHVVDASDYTVWRDSLGSTTNLAADGNGDRVIDQQDFDVWSQHVGDATYAGIGVAISYQGGAEDSWTYSSVPLPVDFDQGAANPSVKFDNVDHDPAMAGVQSNVYVSFMAATFLGGKPPLTNPSGGTLRALGFQSNNGIFVSRSNDGGNTWQLAVAAEPTPNMYDGTTPTSFDINPDLAVDTFRYLSDGKTLNPNYGALYEVWSRYYPAGQFPGESDSTGGSQIMVSISRDGGATWSLQLENRPATGLAETVIKDPIETGVGVPTALGRDFLPHVAVGPDNSVYVSVSIFGSFWVFRGTDGGKSSDGVLHFITPDSTTNQGLPFPTLAPSPLSGGLPPDKFRGLAVRAIVADPSQPGSVYVAESNNTFDSVGNVTDEGDIIFARSSDTGATWQSSFQLNGQQVSLLNDENDGQLYQGFPDDVPSGQIMPRLAVDASGTVAVIWYDTRHDPNNAQLDIFATVSHDGGKTFSPNFRVTDSSFDPDLGKFTDATGHADYYLGDLIGMALAGNSMYAAWTDTRNGNEDIYFQRISLTQTPAPPNDRYEPNDSPSAATDLGQVINEHLPKLSDSAGDQDWFRVTTTATGHLDISAMREATDTPPRLELYDSSGHNLLASGVDALDSTGQLAGQTISYASSVNETYLVRVLPGDGAIAGESARYTLEVESLTADLGSLVHGDEDFNIQSQGDTAHYLLNTPASGSLLLTATPKSGFQGQLQLQVLDPKTLAVLAAGSDSADGSGLVAASLAVAAGQSLLVSISGDENTLGGISLELTNFDQFSSPDSNTESLYAGAGPSSLVVADVNRDRIPDLVVSDALANVVSVLLGNGDGTFQAPQQFEAGAFNKTISGVVNGTPTAGRTVIVADVNGDQMPDLIVTNSASSDISVLLGNGDGTFQPQRRFGASPRPFGLAAGDFNNDGLTDLVTVDSTPGKQGKIAILRARPNGQFAPPIVFDSPLVDDNPQVTVKVGDLNRDGKEDFVLTDDGDPNTHIFLGNGDGTFHRAPDYKTFGPGLVLVDLNGDHILDLVQSQRLGDTVAYALGNGDGTFKPHDINVVFNQDPQLHSVGQSPIAVAVGDIDGDGIPDVVTADSGTDQPVLFGPPAISLLHGQVDDQGSFAGFTGDDQDNPITLANPNGPQDIQIANLVTGNGGNKKADVIIVDRDGILVIFGQPPSIPANNTLGTARDLGSVVHAVEPTFSIVPDHTDAYFKLTVPAEADTSAGDQVMDFSSGFADQVGAGLSMEILDSHGNKLAAGDRVRFTAHQGETLVVHIFGNTGSGNVKGLGAYTLVIDALPQVASAEAQSLLPGQNNQSGGPTTNITLQIQGDRLDAATAQNVANYAVTWLGPDHIAGTADDQQIAVGEGLPTGAQAIVYDPGTNIDVSSGLTYPTAVRQTVTLLFGTPLPAGDYQIAVSPNVMSASFNENELALITPQANFHGHSLVTAASQEGADLTVTNLVQPIGALGNLSTFESGNRFLIQFHGDAGAFLDSILTAHGDASTTTADLLAQVVAQFAPALFNPGGQPIVRLLVGIFDPVSFGLVDPDGRSFRYDLQTNTVGGGLPNAFVEVGGNVELIVIADPEAKYDLKVADVAAHARGGFVYFGSQGAQNYAFTDLIRAGAQQFGHSFAGLDLTAALVSSVTSATQVTEPTPFLSAAVNSSQAGNANFSSIVLLVTAGLAFDQGAAGSDAVEGATYAGSGMVVDAPAGAIQAAWDELSELWDELDDKVTAHSTPAHDDSATEPSQLAPNQLWHSLTGILDDVFGKSSHATHSQSTVHLGQPLRHNTAKPTSNQSGRAIPPGPNVKRGQASSKPQQSMTGAVTWSNLLPGKEVAAPVAGRPSTKANSSAMPATSS
jgi:hypothetical protein